MYCSKCGKEREGSAPECGCGAAFGGLPAGNTKAYGILNACMLAFTGVLTVVSLIALFAAAFGEGSVGAVAGITGTYVLCMLLAIPSLKVFLDKVSCPVFKKLNMVFIITGFAAILIHAVMAVLATGFPTML